MAIEVVPSPCRTTSELKTVATVRGTTGKVKLNFHNDLLEDNQESVILSLVCRPKCIRHMCLNGLQDCCCIFVPRDTTHLVVSEHGHHHQKSKPYYLFMVYRVAELSR